MVEGMRVSGIGVVHLVCLLASNKSLYIAVLKVGKMRVNE
jgi:hypothetical protein